MLHLNGVYSITCLPTGRKYVGSAARSFQRRFDNHRSQLRRGVHPSTYMQRSWNKYGPDAFEFKIELVCAPEHVLEYEQRLLDAWRPAFNTALIAGSVVGTKRTPEQRAAMAARMRGTKQSPEVVAKRFATRAGYRHSDETRRKMAASAGHPHTVEARERMRLAKAAKVPKHLVRGELLTLVEIAKKHGVRYNTLHARMKRGLEGEALLAGRAS